MNESVSAARVARNGLTQNSLYCERCGFSENDHEETILTCNCVKGKTYDLDRALSEIEEFFNEK
jgi:hypothetical protein